MFYTSCLCNEAITVSKYYLCKNLFLKRDWGDLAPDQIMRQIETSLQKLITGTAKNIQNIKTGQPGQPVEEGIRTYCV